MSGNVTIDSNTSYLRRESHGILRRERDDSRGVGGRYGRRLWRCGSSHRDTYTKFNAFWGLDEATNEHIDVQDDHGNLS
jgi:hypothetical protein